MSGTADTRGAALDARGNPQAHNLRLVGHCPMDGRGGGMHINLKDGYAYFAHMGEYGIGTFIIDVRDPTAPMLVKQLPLPPGVHSHKAQIVGDILLVNYERTGPGDAPVGLKVYDASQPTEPREIAWFVPEPPPGRQSIQFNDLTVDEAGLIDVSDRFAGGLYIFESTGELAGRA